jgi:hypothetical protein
MVVAQQAALLLLVVVVVVAQLRSAHQQPTESAPQAVQAQRSRWQERHQPAPMSLAPTRSVVVVAHLVTLHQALVVPVVVVVVLVRLARLAQ